MVEVFKTNVTEPHHANMIVERIHHAYTNYKANFDLEDCDNILRIKCHEGNISPSCLIELLKNLGFYAEVLT
ncbi:MAG: hypothetical protein ABIN91_15540 [Mucilaginibacter sp.]|uniref:hypothetical protein n=1 Tax=Mucilaginibacter sp. TaxID=1882438 RepID=UPI003266025C